MTGTNAATTRARRLSHQGGTTPGQLANVIARFAYNFDSNILLFIHFMCLLVRLLYTNILIIIFLFAIRGPKVLILPRALKISGPALCVDYIWDSIGTHYILLCTSQKICSDVVVVYNKSSVGGNSKLTCSIMSFLEYRTLEWLFHIALFYFIVLLLFANYRISFVPLSRAAEFISSTKKITPCILRNNSFIDMEKAKLLP
jgi:hypothetical protein